MLVNTLQEEYMDYLSKTRNMRQEIQNITLQINKLAEENISDKDYIINLQQLLASKKNDSGSSVNTRGDTLINDTSNNGSSRPSLKKYPTKDSEINYFGEYLESDPYEEVSELKLYENFLIIGAKEEFFEFDAKLTPEVLYGYPGSFDKESELSRLIKAYAFPKGLTPTAFKDDQIDTQINEILYYSHHREGNSFIFTLDSIVQNDDFGYPEMPNNDKSVLYCCCVIYKVFVVDCYGQHYIVPRCNCLVSYFPCFELHFQVLYAMLAIKVTQRNLKITYGSQHREDLVEEEEEGLIEAYYEYECNILTNKLLQVCISLQSAETIDYSFPLDYYSMDKYWFSPLIFSLLNIIDFYCVLSAVLQEKSVIFFSKNLDFLSSCVLGYRSLVMPFKCQQLVIPIMLESDLARLNDTQGFLVGYPGPCTIEIERQLSQAVRVNLDDMHAESRVSDNNNDRTIRNSSITYNLIDKINAPYRIFVNEPVYLPGERHVEATRRILEEIQRFIKWIVNEISICVDSKQDFSRKKICDRIELKASNCNRQFLCNIVKTKMLQVYFSKPQAF